MLPSPDGSRVDYRLGDPGPWRRPDRPLTSRIAYAAAHVVPVALADNTPGAPAVVDWDTTLAFRHELWSYGLGVADAMDTAQRGMGLDWAATQELIKRSGAEASSAGGLLACGAGTDQLDLATLPAGRAGRQRVLDAYREQIDLVSGAGARVIVMASRALARVATTPEDYRRVYDAVLSEATEPVILHWLGPMFDPALTGYWGSPDVAAATETFVELVTEHAARVDGVKVSLLDAAHETALRARLAALGDPVRLYTGDDFNYPELIDGDGSHHSDALLGIFAAIYPAASTALQAYDAGDPAAGRAILDATRDLGRTSVRGADVLLQDRDRLPGLAQRPPAGVRHGRRAAGQPVAAAPARGLPAGRPRGPAARPGARRPPAPAAAGRPRVRGLRWATSTGCP